ncbi:TPA: hypothetical protein KEY68_001021 [Providencia rettgeri]|uniref:TcdA/TcdB pore-forming domain-containing protein n=1 Tax=Providencia sp. PROV141 TaxID=2949851 RepID=UPI001B9733BE|nr:TcdA/TcdB pore-forming domain-containing protein [Providencia sp. PROV141]HBC7428778.1 hypothetical protein [Providencia rettgeri]
MHKVTDNVLSIEIQYNYFLKEKINKWYSINNTFIQQAILDKNLKSGVISGVRIRNRDADSKIKLFKLNPIEFLVNNSISTDSITKSGNQPPKVDIQFVKVDHDSYEIEPVLNSSVKDPSMQIESYLLGYNGANQSNISPAYIDIPKHPSKAKFLFTGTLSGCSIIVTDLDETTYRVYHDGRVNSSILYDNVVMAVNYKDYQCQYSDEGLGMAYMQYENGSWQLVLQKQEYKIIDGVPIITRRDDKASLMVQFPLAQDSQGNIQQFMLLRDEKYHELMRIAKECGVSTNILNEIKYQNNDFSSYAEIARPWNELIKKIRESIQSELDEQLIKLDKLRGEIVELNSENEKYSLEYNTLKNELSNIEFSHDYLKMKYNKSLSEILNVERNWIWLKIKEKKGIDSVVDHEYDNSVKLGGKNKLDIPIEKRFKLVVRNDSTLNNSLFFSGYNNYESINFNFSTEKLSSLELKKIYLNGELTIEQKGALSHYIEIKFESEYSAYVLNKSKEIKDFFIKFGSINARLIPQDFYLLSVKDNNGGRCYPLVRAMAVALAREDKKGADNLIDKLFYATSSPKELDSVLLKKSLIALHSNVPANQASSSNGVLNLKEIQYMFSKYNSTVMYSLNTMSHAMLLGKIVKEEEVKYYFYDPNFGIFEFNDEAKLFSSLKKYLLIKKMAEFYNAMGSETEPKFELVTIDIKRMADVPIGYGLVVGDLHNKNELSVVSEQRVKVDLFIENENIINHDLQLKVSLQILDAKQWGERIDAAIRKITQEYRLDNKWLINFFNIVRLDDNNYRIQFIHQDQTIEPRWVETSDHTFMEFSHYFNQQLAEVKNNDIFFKRNLSAGKYPVDVESADGLNSGIAIQTLIQWASNKNRASLQGAESNLSIALKIHSYTNYTMMAHGIANDMAKVTNVVKSLWQDGADIFKNNTHSFANTVAHTANEGVGLVFNGALVGLDIYELTQSETASQKAIFGTQLGFDSTALALGITSIYTGAIGATGIAAFCSSGAVILGGLTIGFTALAKNFGIIAEDAQEVGHYFYLLDKAYQGNGFDFIENGSLLVAKQGAVIEKIDFQNNQMVFGSQYIYRSGKHEAGGGYRNYFFWASYANVINHDRKDALNVREIMEYMESIHSVDYDKAEIIILPGTPKSYINYNHSMLPGATTRGDSGFNVLRRMEKSKKFDFDYYVFPSEYIISKLKQEYIKTNIDVLLDAHKRKIAIPRIPKEWYGLLNYTIESVGEDYEIILNEGVELTLKNKFVKNKKSNLVINATLLNSDVTHILNDQLIIGGITIHIDSSSEYGSVTIVGKNNEIRLVDFTNMRSDIIQEDANQWGNSQGSIDEYLDELAKKNELHEKYIIVENYKFNGVEVGRAFYDVKNKRMIYLKSGYAKGSLTLLEAVIDGKAYLKLPDKLVVAIVDINTNKTLAMYSFGTSFDGRTKNIKVWQVDNQVYISCTTIKDKFKVESVYQCNNNSLYLLSISTIGFIPSDLDINNKNKLVESIKEKLSPFYYSNIDNNYSFNSQVLTNKEIKLADIIMFSGEIPGEKNIRFWLRNKDGVIINANIKESGSSEVGHIGLNLDVSNYKTMSNYLIYIGGEYNSKGIEVFYFYNTESHILYWQEDALLNESDKNNTIAHAAELKNIINVVNRDGRCIATTQEGAIYHILPNGKPNLIAVNKLWLKTHKNWFAELTNRIGDNSVISILGLTNKENNQKIFTWYMNGNLFVSIRFSSNQKLKFLGCDEKKESIYLFDMDSGKLYMQEKLRTSTIKQAFTSEGILISPELINSSHRLYSEFIYKDANRCGDNLILKTVDDDVVIHSINNLTNYEKTNEGKSVLIKSGDDDDNILSVYESSDIKKIIFHGEEGNDTYVISADMWKDSRVIVIDNHSVDLKIDEAIFLIDDLDEILVNRNNNDLVFTDKRYNTKLIFRQVFGLHAKQHQHLNIIVPNKVENIALDKLLQRYEQYGSFMSLSTYYNYDAINNSNLGESIVSMKEDKSVYGQGIIGDKKMSRADRILAIEME